MASSTGSRDNPYDAVIVGGGPAGLNAALILGRCRRRVLLCDSGAPRNAVSRGVHGFLSRDGTPPGELRRIAREELRPYDSVELRDVVVVDAAVRPHGFDVTLADGGTVPARKLLLATGLTEELPEIAGVEEFWGRGVYSCPYCDGWEHRDQPIAAYGLRDAAKGLALEMKIWSGDVVLCTDGPAGLSKDDEAELDRHGIPVIEDRLARLEGSGRGLERICFASGRIIERRALFYVYGERECSELATRLGCELTQTGTVKTRSYEKTNVPGLYVAGDASRRVQFAIVAAAEGAAAAFAINTELWKEDLARS
jgi:thioredoxin reductase